MSPIHTYVAQRLPPLMADPILIEQVCSTC
jgi:hypothetical protein